MGRLPIFLSWLWSKDWIKQIHLHPGPTPEVACLSCFEVVSKGVEFVVVDGFISHLAFETPVLSQAANICAFFYRRQAHQVLWTKAMEAIEWHLGLHLKKPLETAHYKSPRPLWFWFTMKNFTPSFTFLNFSLTFLCLRNLFITTWHLAWPRNFM